VDNLAHSPLCCFSAVYADIGNWLQEYPPGSFTVSVSPAGAPSSLCCSRLLKSPRTLILALPTAPQLLLQGRLGTLVLAGVSHWVGSNGDQLPTKVDGVKAKHEQQKALLHSSSAVWMFAQVIQALGGRRRKSHICY